MNFNILLMFLVALIFFIMIADLIWLHHKNRNYMRLITKVVNLEKTIQDVDIDNNNLVIKVANLEKIIEDIKNDKS